MKAQRRRSIRRPSGFVPLPGGVGGSSPPNDDTASGGSPSPRKSGGLPRPLHAVKTCILVPAGAFDRLDQEVVHATKSCVTVVDEARDDNTPYKLMKLTQRNQQSLYDIDACGDGLEGMTEDSPGGLIHELSGVFASGGNVALLHAGQRGDKDLPPFMFTHGGGSVISSFLHQTLKAVAPSPMLRISLTSVETSMHLPGHEVMLSCFAFAEGKVRDLLVVGGTEDEATQYQRVPVYEHFVTGPRFVGLSYKPVRSMEDWESYCTLARSKVVSSKRAPVVVLSVILKQITTAAGDFSNLGGGDAPDVLLSTLLAVDFGERISVATKAVDGTITSELSELLKYALGGNCTTAFVGSLPAYDDSTCAQSILSLLQKASLISSSRVKQGSVKSAIVEVQDHVGALRDRLANTPTMDTAARKRMEAEMVAKEQQLRELQEYLDRAAENASLAHQLARATQLQRLNENENKKVMSMLDTEKKRRFAQAFRAAFQKREAVTMNSAELSNLNRRLEEAESRVEELQQQRDKLLEERDNLRRYGEQQTSDLKAEQHQRSMLETQVAKAKRMTAEHDATIIELETDLRRAHLSAKAPSRAFVLEHAACKTQNAQLQADVTNLRSELSGSVARCTQLDLKVEELTSELASAAHARASAAELECTGLREKLSFRDAALAELQANITHTNERFADLQSKYLDEVRCNGRLREDLHHKVQQLRNKYSVEREAYLEFLHEGQCYVDEVRHLVDMQIDMKPSAYRGDRTSVVAWLTALGGLEGLASTLFNHGFDTMHAVSMLREDDLVKMHCTAGTRRKIMHSVRELAEQYEGVLRRSVALFRTMGPQESAPDHHESTTSLTSKLWDNKDINDHLTSHVSMTTLVNDLEAWISDFKTSIDAESEMTKHFVVSST